MLNQLDVLQSFQSLFSTKFLFAFRCWRNSCVCVMNVYKVDVIRSPSLYRPVPSSLTHLQPLCLHEKISLFGAVFSPAVISLSGCKHSMGTGWCRQGDRQAARGDLRAKSLTSVLHYVRNSNPWTLVNSTSIKFRSLCITFAIF